MPFMSWIYSNIIIPASYYLRGDLRFWYYNQYKKNLLKSKKYIKAYQLDHLKKLVKHAYETVPYYTALFNKINLKPEDINSLENLKKIPVLKKEIILSRVNELKSNKKYKLIECASGGSTGNRVVIFKDKRYEQISRGIWLRDMYSAGIKPGDKCAWIWCAPSENEKLAKKIMHKLLWRTNRRIILNAAHYTDAELKEWLVNKFNKFKPSCIYGYANSIYQIAKFIRENNIKIHKVKRVVTTSEKLEHRDYIEEIFGGKAINHYGSREILSIAIEDNKGVMHSSDDFVIVEVLDKKIILTPLESYGMPLIRYEIGDMGLKTNPKRSQDSYPFNEFNISVGRLCELFVNKKGERVSMLPFSVALSKAKLSIGEFQLVQKSIQKIIVNVVNKEKNISTTDLSKLKHLIKDYLGCSKIKVNYFDKFPLEQSGKKIGYKCLIKEEVE